MVRLGWVRLAQLRLGKESELLFCQQSASRTILHHLDGSEDVLLVIPTSPRSFKRQSSQTVEVVIWSSSKPDDEQCRHPGLQMLQMGLRGATFGRVVLPEASVEVNGCSEVSLLLLGPADEEVAKTYGRRNIHVEKLQNPGGRGNHSDWRV